MSTELVVWLIVSLVGVLGLPFVWRRRARESTFHRYMGGNGVRGIMLSGREKRAWALSVGVVLCATVPLVTWLVPPNDERRFVTIVMLIGAEISIVAALWLDEWYAERIDHAPSVIEQGFADIAAAGEKRDVHMGELRAAMAELRAAMANLQRTSDNTHTLVNSVHGAALMATVVALRQVVRLTSDPTERASAADSLAEAERLYTEHQKKQRVVDEREEERSA